LAWAIPIATLIRKPKQIHQNKPTPMQTQLSSVITTALTGVLALGLAASAFAQEKKVDPTGTWTWSFTTPNGNTINQSLKLKLDGDKLTGAVVGRQGREAAIEEAKLTGNEVSFQVKRERQGNTLVTKYKGKISGDTIKGTIESNAGGENRTRDWEAKREAKKD
jgi:hypothetical protein